MNKELLPEPLPNSSTKDAVLPSAPLAQNPLLCAVKNSYGCGIQCIAKVAYLQPNDVRNMATNDFPSHTEVVSILKTLGYKIKTPFCSTIFENKKYIVTVPSLNNVGEFHFVVMWYDNGIKVFDPVKSRSKKRYVSVNKKNLSANEFKVLSWTSIIEVSD